MFAGVVLRRVVLEAMIGPVCAMRKSLDCLRVRAVETGIDLGGFVERSFQEASTRWSLQGATPGHGWDG